VNPNWLGLRSYNLNRGEDMLNLPWTKSFFVNLPLNIMNPLVVDVNHNFLDGHHRFYALKRKGQNIVRVAGVHPSVIKKADRFRAPKGGVNINGKFYRGEMYIPKGVLEVMNEEDKKTKTFYR